MKLGSRASSPIVLSILGFTVWGLGFRVRTCWLTLRAQLQKGFRVTSALGLQGLILISGLSGASVGCLSC